LLQESELAPLLDQFVCVRVIDANALDLDLFQFDYDLSFSTLFFNGNGTVYGRYGSWRHQKESQDKTTAGYKRALEAALAIHRNFPGNKASLAGKQGRQIPFKTPVDIPELAAKYKPQLDWEGNVVRSCIHCHQIGEALRERAHAEGKRLPLEMIYPWPAPETIGITLASDSIARIEAIAKGSPAAVAGLKVGDELISMDGEPLISSTDVSWILNSQPSEGNLEATVASGKSARSVNLFLPDGWRNKTDISGRVSAWQLRGMGTGGLVLQDLTNEARAERKLSESQMALAVTFVGQYGKHAAAKQAGFNKDDVITMIDGQSTRMTEGEILGYLLRNHEPGSPVKMKVLRGEEQLDLTLPIQ
jgi:hypothetical protein